MFILLRARSRKKLASACEFATMAPRMQSFKGVQKMATAIGPTDVMEAFNKAVSLLGHEMPLDQKSVKRVVVITIDLLVGKLRQRKIKPWLYASHTALDGLSKKLQHTRPWERISMLDVGVYAGNKEPFETLVTAESEAFADEILPTSTSETCDYLWDLYNLLQVPSPRRLFLARTRTYARCRDL